MEERRKQSFIRGNDMDDLKERLSRIEKQGVDAHISGKVLESSYEAHKIQNEKDFNHVDECIHRSDAESKDRDNHIVTQLDSMADDIQELKQFMWKWMGALAVLLPIANYLVGKYL